jgi:peptide/nickel transport system permease protein
MWRFLAVRTAQGLLTLLAVTVIIFVISRLTGDPVNFLMPQEASIAQRNALREALGFNRPWVVQYWDFLSNLLVGNFGNSISTQRPVLEMILQRLPATVQLGGAALFLSLAVGIPLGVYAGYWRDGALDQFVRFFAVLGQSAPTFWVGIILVLVFALHLNLLPTGGRGGIEHLILPAVTMAWASLAGVTRLMRSSLMENLEADYVTFCRIKGLSERAVLWKHAFRNAFLPVLTFGGVLAANAITGSVVTEAVFVWPGMGRLLIDAIEGRDFPVVQGIVIVYSAVYVVCALAVDVLYAYLNPRLRTA